MASIWSDDASTLASSTSPSPESVKKEVKRVHALLDSLSRSTKRQGKLKRTAIIAIVRMEGVSDLNRAFKRPWWKFWKDPAPIFITSSDELRETLEEIEENRRLKRIIMVASDEVSEIDFSVPSRISTMFIRRCSSIRNPEGILIVKGSATFHNIRLDEWEARPRRHKLYLGEGVRIQVLPDQVPSWAGYTDRLSHAERAKIFEYIRSMNETEMNGNWWEQWKGYIAGILAVAVTGTKLASGISANARGFFVDFQWMGLSSCRAGAFDAGFRAFGKAAGPSILLGAAVGAAVYFIPWDVVFTWLKGPFRSFANWLSRLCAKVFNLGSKTPMTHGIDGEHWQPSFPMTG